MAKQALNLGISANDGTGDTLRSGGDKINDNFNEIYGSLGNGTGLLDVVNNNLEIDVSGKSNKISFLYDQLADLPDAATYHGAIAHVHATGALYYAHNGVWSKLLSDNSVLGGINNYTDPLQAVAYAGTLGSLEDVDLSTPPTQDQVIAWSGSAWVPTDQSGGSSALALGDLTNVSSNTPTSGQVLKWDGNQWAPAADITSGGTGLDADTLDGQDGSYYLNFANLTGAASPTSLTIGGRTVNTISTDIASNRTTALATEATVKAYVDANAGGGGSIDPTTDLEVNTVTASSFINDGTGTPEIVSGSSLIITAPGGVVVSDSLSADLFDITRSTETLVATSLSTTTNLNTQNAQIFYLTGSGSLSATLNFQNVPTTNNKTISFAIVVDQTANADTIGTVQIDGVSQTVNWVGGSAPSGNASAKDVFNFTFIRTSNSWVVLGNLTSFS